jgi:peptidoglycan/xylan/chitin deacetylase (PgdA/CDA1 family)
MLIQVIKQLIKNTIAYLLYYSGLLSYLKQTKLKNKACVLMYHRVIPARRLPDIHSASAIVTEDVLFRRHLGWLKEEFNVMSVSDLKEIFRNKCEIPSQSCLVTFDDGWVDNYDHAWPSLNQFKIPATIFLPYQYIGNEIVFWQEELLARLSLLIQSESKSDRLLLEQLGLRDELDRERLRQYVTELKQKEYQDIDALLSSLREHQQEQAPNLSNDAYLTWEQVYEMARSTVSYGSHAMTHRILTKIDEEEARCEIFESKQLIEEKLKVPVDTIAYPNGNYSQTIEGMAAASGYQLGFTTERGFVSKDSNQLALPRINISTHVARNKPLFLCQILNIF